ncbi:MAG: DUF3853 family protein [Salinivirgaceae bacterium]|nr:DUF3853 family protein [Salinivirgaceae bacterium]
MKKDLTKKTLAELTVGELISILDAHIFAREREKELEDNNNVYNDKGLMRFLRCSRSTLYRLKKSGILTPAMTRLGGNNYKADKAMILSILRENKKNNEKK